MKDIIKTGFGIVRYNSNTYSVVEISKAVYDEETNTWAGYSAAYGGWLVVDNSCFYEDWMDAMDIARAKVKEEK